MKTTITSSSEADALLFIEGFRCKSEGEICLSVFCPLGRVRRTHKPEGFVRTLATNAERSVLFQQISPCDQSWGLTQSNSLRPPARAQISESLSLQVVQQNCDQFQAKVRKMITLSGGSCTSLCLALTTVAGAKQTCCLIQGCSPKNSDYTTLAATLQLLSEAASIVYFKSVDVLSGLSEEHRLWGSGL